MELHILMASVDRTPFGKKCESRRDHHLHGEGQRAGEIERKVELVNC